MFSHATKGKWTFETVQKEALLYSKRFDFQKGSNGAYDAAHKNGWLDEVCSHMQNKPRTNWTFVLLQQEALKYKSRSEFGRAAKGAYAYALRNGFLDEVCGHMKPFDSHLDKESY